MTCASFCHESSAPRDDHTSSDDIAAYRHRKADRLLYRVQREPVLESCAFLGIGNNTGSRMGYADTVVRQNLEFDPAFPLVFWATSPTILTPSFSVADGVTAIS
jgi:hypothetical protein